jgi:hypothetical protein
VTTLAALPGSERTITPVSERIRALTSVWVGVILGKAVTTGFWTALVGAGSVAVGGKGVWVGCSNTPG